MSAVLSVIWSALLVPARAIKRRWEQAQLDAEVRLVWQEHDVQVPLFVDIAPMAMDDMAALATYIEGAQDMVSKALDHLGDIHLKELLDHSMPISELDSFDFTRIFITHGIGLVVVIAEHRISEDGRLPVLVIDASMYSADVEETPWPQQ